MNLETLGRKTRSAVAAACCVGLLSPDVAAGISFREQEDLAYEGFIKETYPSGIRAPWGGVYMSYLPAHSTDPNTGNPLPVFSEHHVNTESTSLLAQLAVMRGDQATLDQMLAQWTDPGLFYSSKFQLTHWILDETGAKETGEGNGPVQTAPGEEARMLEVLKNAYDRFGDARYKDLAREIADGMKGINGGQGLFEPAAVFLTSSGDGDVDDVWLEERPVRRIRVEMTERTPVNVWGYSLWEVEAYGSQTGNENLALGAAVSVSSVEGPALEAANAVDGDGSTRWSSESGEQPQYIEIDLGQVRSVNRIVLKWETAAAKSYAVRLDPDPSEGFLLRSGFAWNQTTDEPVSRPWDPAFTPFNVNNFLGYHYAATWLGDPFYQQVLDHTLDKILASQDPATGMFRPRYNILLHQYADEFGKDECAVLACADIATRMSAYGRAAERSDLVAAGRKYYEFIKRHYIEDGVIWASYDHDGGQAVDFYASIPIYAFFAKMAMEFRDWDMAEKVIREQLLTTQVLEGSGHPSLDQPGYLGAFKQRVDSVQSAHSYYQDAISFENLEVLVALNIWNNADKGGWRSSYPAWKTVAAVTNGDGGDDVVELDRPVRTRYVRVLGKRRKTGNVWGYSIYTLKVLDRWGRDLARGKTVTASGVQGGEHPPTSAVDGDDDLSRWSTAPGPGPEWILVDLGEEKWIHRVEIKWETAAAADYDVQAGFPRRSFPRATAPSEESLGECFSFPNPARKGRSPTLHVEMGDADDVELEIFDAAGALVHQARLDAPSSGGGKGGRSVHEYRWDVSGVSSGVYTCVVRARNGGSSGAKKTFRVGVLK